MPTAPNLDPAELLKFDAMQDHWWNPTGALRSLHHINTLRVAYVSAGVNLTDRRLLDVGCGGGILTEPLARLGARAIGIDATASAVQVAHRHARDQDLDIDYRVQTVEALAAMAPASFDVITCMELLEHVPEPAEIVQACATLLAPGGHLFFATLNRTIAAFLMAIVGAEYLMGLLPRGTHSWGKFVRPAELRRWAGQSGLDCRDVKGFSYNPFKGNSRYCNHTAVNYLAYFRRPPF